MKTFVLLGILALSLSVRAADQPKPVEGKDSRQLLQEGLFEEEANRDLNKAGDDYSAVLRQYEAQRNLAATALFRLAEIRGKQGNKAEAITLFQRLLTEFPGDENLTKLSRERLAALGAPAAVAAKPDPEMTAEEADELIHLREIVKESPDLVAAIVAGSDTRLDLAAKNGWIHAAAFLLDNHVQPTAKTLRAAAEAGHKAMVELLLARGVDVNLKSAGGATALHAACATNRLAIARLLLEKGADPNAVAGEDKEVPHWTGTPLLAAVAIGGLQPTPKGPEMAKLLFDYGANPNLCDPVSGDSPLVRVIVYNDSLVQFVLDHGADPNFHDPKSPSALKFAISSGKEALVNLLLSAHADPNDTSQDFAHGETRAGIKETPGSPPLFLAVKLGNESAVKELLAHGARLDLPAKDGSRLFQQRGILMDAAFVPEKASTILDWAVLVSPAMVRLLLDHGAPVALVPHTDTPLHVSVWQKPLSAVPNVFPPPIEHQIPTGGQIRERREGELEEIKAQIEIWKMLIDKGLDINTVNEQGMTPLHVAAFYDQVPLIALRWLLDHGADPNIKDVKGKTPLDYLSKQAREKLEQKPAPEK